MIGELIIKGKVAFLVGGTGGIGTTISKELSARGAIVFIGFRNKDDGECLANNICESGGKAFLLIQTLHKYNESY